MTPITYTIQSNALYSGRILKLNMPDGPVYGRTAYNPDAPLPSTGNDFDNLPDPVLGMDGNIYALTAVRDGDYLLELLRWVTNWQGGDPVAPSVVASAVIGGEEPDFFNRAIGYLLPGGPDIQAFFSPYIGGTEVTVALSPNAVPQVFTGCAIPRERYQSSEDCVLAVMPSGYVLGYGEQLV